MIKKGIYIAVFMSANGVPNVVESCGMKTFLCSTNDFVEQEKEARRYMESIGASQMYWFQSYPWQLDSPGVNVVDFVQNNGMLVCSE